MNKNVLMIFIWFQPENVHHAGLIASSVGSIMDSAGAHELPGPIYIAIDQRGDR